MHIILRHKNTTYKPKLSLHQKDQDKVCTRNLTYRLADMTYKAYHVAKRSFLIEEKYYITTVNQTTNSYDASYF